METMPVLAPIRALGIPVHVPGDPEYARRTTTWGSPRPADRADGPGPLAVVRPGSVEEVARTVAAVHDAGLDLAARGTGHHVSGSAAATDGVVVDMSRFSAVVTGHGPTVRAGAGSTWEAVALAARNGGGAVPAGNEPSTGVVGLALGGGIGPLTRSWGLTCDRVRSVGLVGPDLAYRRVDADTDPELLAVLRGAGRGAGIVVDVELEIVTAPDRLPAAQVVYDGADTAELLAGWLAAAAACSRETTPQVTLRMLPDSQALPQEARGRRAVVVGAVFTGEAARAGAALRPFRSLGRVLVDQSGDAPLVERARPWRPRLRALSTAHFVSNVTAADVVRLAELAEAAPPGGTLTVRALGGAVGDHGPDDSVFAHRAADHLVIAQAEWTTDEHEPAARAWCDRAGEVLRQAGSTGIYGNFCSDLDAFPALRAEAYGDLRRIDAVLARHDPDGRFRRLADRP